MLANDVICDPPPSSLPSDNNNNNSDDKNDMTLYNFPTFISPFDMSSSTSSNIPAQH